MINYYQMSKIFYIIVITSKMAVFKLYDISKQ